MRCVLRYFRILFDLILLTMKRFDLRNIQYNFISIVDSAVIVSHTT